MNHRYYKARTFKKRQLYILMCKGNMMQKKDIFERYFKLNFLSLVNDRVDNVRITLAQALRHHFLKEISGEFVYDELFNDAVHVLKSDSSSEVRNQVFDIELYPEDKKRDLSLDDFMKQLEELRGESASDNDSMSSEDEMRIENEIRRHNSEDEIDHGPVLKSLRATKQQQFAEEEEIIKQEKLRKRS